MLTFKKEITLAGESKIDGVIAAGYQAKINSDHPEDMTISVWQTNKELYKNNRTICRADQAAFEDTAYILQEELIAEKEAAALKA